MVPSRTFQIVVNGTPDMRDSSCMAACVNVSNSALTSATVGISVFMQQESTAFGRSSQPHSVELSNYRIEMKKVGEILAANATALMAKKYGKVNVTKLAGEPGLSVGVAGRIKNGENVQLDSIQAFAKAFGLEPWQALVPNLEVESPPKLGGSASEWPLDMVDKTRYLALSRRSRDFAQGYLLRVIEDLELKENKKVA